MAITIDGSAGITDADGGAVLSTADIASQAQAEAGTSNTTLMTPLRAAEAIAALTPPGGTQTFTATGSLSNGQLVGLNADGTVSVVTGYYGSEVVFESATTAEISAAYDPVNARVVVVYSDGGNSYYRTAVVGTVTGTSITFGTPVVFRSATINYTSCVYATTSGKIVISYRDDGNSNFGTAIVGTVSGTSISFGTAVVFQSSTVYINGRGSVYDSTSDKVVITYINFGVSPATAVAVVGTVSGTSISFGTPVTFFSLNNWPPNDLCCCSDPATGYVTAFVQSGPGSNQYYNSFVRLKVSGTTVFSGPTLTQTYNTSWPTIVTAGSVSVAAYQARANSNFGTAQVVNMGSTLPDWVGIAAESISTGNDGNVTIVGGIAGGLSALSPGTRYGILNSTGALAVFNFLTTTQYIGTAVSPTELYINTGRV
jgi:hypothetical protein